jgi:two-component system, NtrC family, nitrogen regulation sensor histidine kinase NtrY
VKLRGAALLFLVVTYALLALAAWLLFRQNPWWLYPAELVLAVMLITGTVIFRRLSTPDELFTTATELLADSDYSSTLRMTGVSQLDQVIAIYNRMLEQLREERLRAAEQRSFLEKLLEVSPVGMVTLDFDGSVAQMNDAARRLLTTDAGETPLTALEQLSAGSSTLLSLGQRRLRIFRGEFMDRGFSRTFFVVEELTNELRSAEKAAYEKVIRMTSHEINNSIGAVRSLLESLTSFEPKLPPEERELYDEALSVSSRRLEALASFTREIAAVARIPEPERRELRLDLLIADLQTLLAPELRERAIRIDSRIEGQPVIIADKNQVEQVLVNILRNAAESIGRDGVIDISTTRQDDRLRLTIGDTGGGLAPGVETMLFTPFFSTKREGRGTGLTLVAEILSRHGAGYSLTDRPGGGAVFTIIF